MFSRARERRDTGTRARARRTGAWRPPPESPRPTAPSGAGRRARQPRGRRGTTRCWSARRASTCARRSREKEASSSPRRAPSRPARPLAPRGARREPRSPGRSPPRRAPRRSEAHRGRRRDARRARRRGSGAARRRARVAPSPAGPAAIRARRRGRGSRPRGAARRSGGTGGSRQRRSSTPPRRARTSSGTARASLAGRRTQLGRDESRRAGPRALSVESQAPEPRAAEASTSGPVASLLAVPIYEYKCPKGHVFELFQKMSDPPPEVCIVCGEGPLQKVLYPVAAHFKGSGFYSTDYGRKGRKPSGDGDKPSKSRLGRQGRQGRQEGRQEGRDLI